jgi:hypothetical protein
MNAREPIWKNDTRDQFVYSDDGDIYPELYTILVNKRAHTLCKLRTESDQDFFARVCKKAAYYQCFYRKKTKNSLYPHAHIFTGCGISDLDRKHCSKLENMRRLMHIGTTDASTLKRIQALNRFCKLYGSVQLTEVI